MIPKRANKKEDKNRSKMVSLGLVWQLTTYVEDLLDGEVNLRIVFFGRLLEICRIITDQISEHP